MDATACQYHGTYIRDLPVRPCMVPEPPDMMEAMRRSALVMRRGATSGISIASLLRTPAWWDEDRLWYRGGDPENLTCLWPRGCRFQTPARISSSILQPNYYKERNILQGNNTHLVIESTAFCMSCGISSPALVMRSSSSWTAREVLQT